MCMNQEYNTITTKKEIKMNELIKWEKDSTEASCTAFIKTHFYKIEKTSFSRCCSFYLVHPKKMWILHQNRCLCCSFLL